MKLKERVYTLLLFVACLSTVSCGGLTPGTAREMSVEELSGLMAHGRSPVLVDTRTEYEYRKGHLPGAVNIPPYRFGVISTLLPKDKETEIVFYCRGYGWDQAKNAAGAAREAGYGNVVTLSGGYPEWVAKGYAVER